MSKFTTITLHLSNLLAVEHDCGMLPVSLPVIEHGGRHQDKSDTEYLATILAALGTSGIKFNVFTTDEKPYDPLADRLADAERGVERLLMQLNQATIDRDYWQAQNSAAQAKLLDLELGPPEGRQAKADEYLKVANVEGHEHYGKKVEQIKRVRTMLTMSLKDAKDYVERVYVTPKPGTPGVGLGW